MRHVRFLPVAGRVHRVFVAAVALSVMLGGPAWATINAQLETFLTT